jgi:uncharacterized protein YjbJ (UPF0337 family)
MVHGGRELVREEPLHERRQLMDKDRMKGTVNEIAGRAKRQAGEWTGDTKTEIAGLAQEVKGKTQKAWANVKDAARNAEDEAQREQAQSERRDIRSGADR